MNIFPANEKNILKASELINKGELVAFPTETVYGLGADALNPLAVAKIFEVKKRPSFNPLIVHIAEKEKLFEICNSKSSLIEKLISKFWPGPLTLVLPKQKNIPDIVTAGNDTVAIRMPNHQVALQLISAARTPIAAPSANVFGRLSPTNANHVKKQLGNKVKMILDGGSCSVGVESTILQITENEIFILRHGGITIEKIKKVISKPIKEKIHLENPLSPGQLKSHYSPTTPLYFLDNKLLEKYSEKKVGVIFFSEIKFDFDFKVIKILSHNRDMKEASANLFKHLYDLENENIDIIFVEPIEEKGLGKAIMDRLKRAAHKFKQTEN